MVLVIIAGCQPGAPTNPAGPISSEPIVSSPAPTFQSITGTESSSTTGIIQGLLGDVTQTVSGLITPLLGGTLRLSHSRLAVPPLSVLAPTLATFSMTNETPAGLPGALNKVYEFSPDGLIFLVASTLYVSFADAGIDNQDPHDYTFYYFNTVHNLWEAQPTEVDTVNQGFVVTLHHFSRYAFGR
jgi:hypothetical protein